MSSAWERGTLEDLVVDEFGIKSGPFGTTLRAAEYGKVGVPVISVGEVGYGEFRLREETPRVSSEITSRLAEYVLHEGDIVFGRKGAVDRSARVSSAQHGWFLGSDGLRVRLHSGNDSRFVAFQLRTAAVREWLLRHAGGSTLLSLNQGTLARVPVVIPPLGEQKAIAEVLGALDEKIAANLALLATVDSYLATLLNKMAEGSGWTMLRSIADVNKRAVKPVAGGSLRYVDIASVGVGSFKYPEVSSWNDAPGRARRGLSAGDTMWSTVRPNRRSHALNLDDDALLVASTGLAILSPREVGFAYLYEVTRRPEFTAYLGNVAEGSAYPAVRAEQFLDAPVPDLRAELVEAFELRAAPLRRLIASQTEESRILAATREALLPQLMSGKLHVRDAEAAASDAGA